jgi:outer membrane lipoprotein-sorting protein
VKRTLLALFAITALAACADAWAGGIARNIADGLGAIRSYRGVTTETGFGDAPIASPALPGGAARPKGGADVVASPALPGGAARPKGGADVIASPALPGGAARPKGGADVIARSVVYERPGHIRVETTTPGPHQGELFVYDGSTITLWYPQLLFGVRIHNARAPSAKETLHHIERLTNVNLDAYTFALEDEHAQVAGQRAMQWFVRPARRAPFRMAHRVWNHDPSTLPLKMEFFRDDKSLWYSFAFEELAFDAPIPSNPFTFEFPKNAVVFEWDLDAPGITLDEAREEMNFKVVTPRGHAITKIIRSPHCLPMILVTMDHDGSMLSLTESRFMGEAVHPLGLAIEIGHAPATLAFLGGFTVITWVKDGALLTLTSNLDFATLIGIAESVQ